MDQRGQAGDGRQPRLRVHRAHLDRAEVRARPDVPPQERVVVDLGGLLAPAHELLVVAQFANGGGIVERGKARKVERAGAGEAGVLAVPEGRVRGERLQQRQVGAQAVVDDDRGLGVRHPDVDVHGAGRRARDQPAHLVADRLVALLLDVHDVAEGRVGVQAAADERRALLAQQLAVRGQVLDALGRAAHDRRRGLDQRLVEVVHDRARAGSTRRDELARDVGGTKRELVDEQELLFDAQRKVRRFAEVVLHRRSLRPRGQISCRRDVSKRHFDRGTAPPRA